MKTLLRATQRTMLRLFVAVTVSYLGLSLCCFAATPALIIHGAWYAVQPGDTAAAALDAAASGKFHVFDTSKLQTFSRDGRGTWVVLQADAARPLEARILSLRSPPFGTVTLYDHNGPISSTSLSSTDPALHGHGRIAFVLPEQWPPSAPVLLKFEPSIKPNAPVKFQLQTYAKFRQIDTLWLVMASASLAVMLSMAMIALCFSHMLGDTAFAWYAAYVTSYALLQAVQTGFVFHPLHMMFLVPIVMPVGSGLTAMALVSAVLFMVRFCNLQRHAPWLYALMLASVGITIMLALLHITGLPFTRTIVHTLFNPLLVLCSVLIILAGSIALLHGSRSALFFLFGWLPLLVLTALASAQVNGMLPNIEWLNDASFAAGAIEALVLAVGLADRTLTMRHDHDRARELADRDPLTNILNRRGWISAAQRRMQDTRETHALLFLDLDHFKTLNDEHGHGAGDQALIAVAESLSSELRPQDLLGRFGGEEFIALLCNTDSANALLVAQRLCQHMRRMEIPLNNKGQLLTVSIGLATRYPDDTLSSLIERADAAMYTAKSRGRNRVVDEHQVETARRPILRSSPTTIDIKRPLRGNPRS